MGKSFGGKRAARTEATPQQTERPPRSTKDWNRGFEQGYVCAVANIILTHDEPTIAKDVLRGMGKVDWKIIDDYDRDTLAKVGLAPRRRKAGKRVLCGNVTESDAVSFSPKPS